MRTSRALFTCLAFAAIGLLMALVADGDDRLVGLGGALLFGSFALMAYGKLRRERERNARGTTEAVLEASENGIAGFVIARRRQRDPMQMAATAGVCASGVAMFVFAPAVGEDEAVFRLCGATLALLMGGVFVANVLNRAGLVVKIVDAGILWVTDAPRLIPWPAIGSAALYSYFGNTMLGLRIVDPRATELTTFTKLNMRLNRALMRWELGLTADQLTSDPRFLEWLIYQLHQSPEDRRLIGTQKGLEELHSKWTAIQPLAPPLPGHA